MALRSRLSSKLALAGIAAATVATTWIGVGAAAASSSDPTGGGTAATAGVQPRAGGEHFYTAYLNGGGSTFEYAWDVFKNGTATSAIVPNDGFTGSWTWTASGKHVVFQENGGPCTWQAKKTKHGYNSAAHQKLAVCGGTDYTWYAVKGAPAA